MRYFLCSRCEYLFTEDPVWLSSPEVKSVSRFDTGILARNIQLSKLVSVLLKKIYEENGKFLDYGGGYGVFTRLMRDNGFDFVWHDPYSENLFATGFEYEPGETDRFELVTALEVFEHLPNPLDCMDFCFGSRRSESLFLTTLLYGQQPPAHDDWWYYSKETGQHISFYNMKTMGYLAQRYDLYLHSFADFYHLFTKKRIREHTYRRYCRDFAKKYTSLRLESKTQDDYRSLIARGMNPP